MGRKKGIPNKIPGMTPEVKKVTRNRQLRERRAKNPERFRDQQRRYYSEHKDKMQIFSRKSRLKRKYKISPTDYDNMFQRQAGACKICALPHTSTNKAMHIDHNHDTGKIRGLLCLNCNVKLHVLEDLGFKSKAEQYLLDNN